MFLCVLVVIDKKELKSYFELQLLSLRRLDSNERPPGYEPGELPTAPLRDVKFYKCLLLLFLVCECKVSMFCDNCQIILQIYFLCWSGQGQISSVNLRDKSIKVLLLRLGMLYKKRVEVLLNFNSCCCGGSTRTNDLQVMSLASYQLLHSAMSSFISACCSYFLFASAKLVCFMITAK